MLGSGPGEVSSIHHLFYEDGEEESQDTQRATEIQRETRMDSSCIDMEDHESARLSNDDIVDLTDTTTNDEVYLERHTPLIPLKTLREVETHWTTNRQSSSLQYRVKVHRTKLNIYNIQCARLG